MVPSPADADLSSVGETFPPPKRSGAPITTNQKIAAARAAEQKAKAASKKANSKPRTLPPPGEAFKVTKRKTSSKGARSSKALTTKGKIRAAAKAEKKKADEKKFEKSKGDATKAWKDASADKRAGKTKSGRRATTVRQGSWMDAIESHGRSSLKFISKKPGLKVTVRPTERTKIDQAKLKREAKEAVRQVTAEVTIVKTSRINLMDLDRDIRRRIWQYAVVYPTFFIWPDSLTGKEQPDLAMTCREIRAEVLPIFYGKNFFAINAAPTPRGRGGRAGTEGASSMQPISGFEAIKKWSSMLEESKWMGSIRNWAFIHMPSKSKDMDASDNESEDASFIVSLWLIPQEYSPGIQGCFPEVEVHQDAECVLPGNKQYRRCIIQNAPQWLSQVVIDVIENEGIRGDGIIQVAKMIQSRAGDLIERDCERVVWSIEFGQRRFSSP